MTQKDAYQLMRLGHNIYLTGAAGTGKTHILNRYIAFLRSKKVEVAITASTGIAATHLGGTTVQSWSGIGIKDHLSDEDIALLKNKLYLKLRLLSTKVLIIDEISMLHARQLDMIDIICREFRQNSQPFGGIQVILCGDFFQLPPVTKDGTYPERATQSRVWNDMNLMICYLTRAYRQADPQFLQILNAIRSNSMGNTEFQLLAKTIGQELPKGPIQPTKLYTHNIDVDAINAEELEKISSDSYEYTMTGKGVAPLVDLLKMSCASPEKLVLRKGAQVMFVKNNFGRGYVNGTRGVVIGVDKTGYPIVQILSGRKIIAVPEQWTITEHNLVKAEISQVPLRLAWAITVHKSQGMSLDEAEIDLNKAFVAGMGYVALSRVRSLRGIRLLGINDLALQVDPTIIELDKGLRRGSEHAERYLRELGWWGRFWGRWKYLNYLTRT